MARDGKLPRTLTRIHSKYKVPDRAILLVSAIHFVLGLMLANQLGLVVSMVNFGALTGFLMLHLSVIVHLLWRRKSKDWLRHLVLPVVGMWIIAYVLPNMAVQAKVAGIVWLAIGLVASIWIRLSTRQATSQA